MFWFQRRGPASEQADLRDALLRRHGGQLWVGWKGWALRDLQRISRQQGNLSGRPLLLSKEQILLSISWANADILFVTECKLKYLKKSPYLDELFYFNDRWVDSVFTSEVKLSMWQKSVWIGNLHFVNFHPFVLYRFNKSNMRLEL